MSAAVWAPACMDPDELALWADGPRGSGRDDPRPCDECLLGFAAEMRAIGRCNGTPEGCEEDPEMELTTTTTRRQSLDLVAPCATCVHEPVCALIAAMESIASVGTDAPALPPGLRLALTATIECEHYFRARRAKSPAVAAGERPKRTISPEARERFRQGAMKTQAILAAKRAESAA